MTAVGFEAALETTDEIQLTTTGRVTGRVTSCPVWFTRRDGKLYLLPVEGSDTSWYKNVLKTPAIHLAAGDAQYSAVAAPITDAVAVVQVVEDFRAKYGVHDVADYYPHPNTAVEVPLG